MHHCLISCGCPPFANTSYNNSFLRSPGLEGPGPTIGLGATAVFATIEPAPPGASRFFAQSHLLQEAFIHGGFRQKVTLFKKACIPQRSMEKRQRSMTLVRI